MSEEEGGGYVGIEGFRTLVGDAFDDVGATIHDGFHQLNSKIQDIRKLSLNARTRDAEGPDADGGLSEEIKEVMDILQRTGSGEEYPAMKLPIVPVAATEEGGAKGRRSGKGRASPRVVQMMPCFSKREPPVQGDRIGAGGRKGSPLKGTRLRETQETPGKTEPGEYRPEREAAQQIPQNGESDQNSETTIDTLRKENQDLHHKLSKQTIIVNRLSREKRWLMRWAKTATASGLEVAGPIPAVRDCEEEALGGSRAEEPLVPLDDFSLSSPQGSDG